MRTAVLLAVLLPALAVYGNADPFQRALGDVVDCASCHANLPTFKALARLGDAAFVRTITRSCINLKIEDPDVCTGAIATQGPILAHDLRSFSLLSPTATKFCEAVFGRCAPPPVNEWAVPFPRAAPPAVPAPPVSQGRPPFRVVHFSDVHIDREYTVGAEANCSKPICCRHYEDEPAPHTRVRAGRMGHQHCDAPARLADSMLDAVQAFAGDARFSLFTGDVVDHAVWNVNENNVAKDMQQFAEQWAGKLHTPMFCTLGNHESAPVNSYPRNTTVHEINSEWVFDAQRDFWGQWIGQEASAQLHLHSGSYSTMAPGMNLRIISLNTQYWYKQNFWLYDSDTPQPDPNGILEFVVQELQAAEDAGQRAWILAHMPPGRGDVMHDQSDYFDQVVQRYKNTIAGQFYGHTHADEFCVAYSNYSEPTAENAVSFGMIGPALTPMSGNPAFKVYDIDPDTFEIMDARVYMTNTSDPRYQLQPTWELHYSAREAYGPLVPALTNNTALTPGFWHNVSAAFAANDTAFQQYVRRKSRGARARPCRGECKNGTLCEMRTMRADVCGFKSSPVFHIPDKVDGLEDAMHHDGCEGIGIGHILRKLATKLAPQAEVEDALDDYSLPADSEQVVFSQ